MLKKYYLLPAPNSTQYEINIKVNITINMKKTISKLSYFADLEIYF